MSVCFKANATIICSDRGGKTDLVDVADTANGAVANVETKDEDEQSLSEEECSDNDDSNDDDDDEPENGKETDGNNDTQKCSALSRPLDRIDKLTSSPIDNTSARSVVEWGDDGTNDAGFSQDPRSFLSRIFWNETDVRFYNQTDREVMFVIADEEFTLERTSTAGAGASVNDGGEDGDVGICESLSGVVPISVNLTRSRAHTATQTALKTRCMPLAPHSDSSQYFQEERLTYVTALTKDVDGEDIPWSRVHYENKVINCKRTKSLKFFNKHLKVMAYRIARPPRSSQTQIVSPITSSSICDLKQVTSSNSSTTTVVKSRKRLCIADKQDSKKRIKDGGFK